jgi:hypothetical protein
MLPISTAWLARCFDEDAWAEIRRSSSASSRARPRRSPPTRSNPSFVVVADRAAAGSSSAIDKIGSP